MKSYTNRLFVVLSIVLLICACGTFIVRSINFALYPFPLENGEGICAHMSFLLKHAMLYKKLTELPYIVANYPPVFFILNFFSLENNIFTIGRLLSAISILGSGFVIYRIIFLLSGNLFASILGAVFFFIYPFVNRAGMMYRVDMAASFFSLLGFYCIIQNRKNRFFWGGFFFILGLYTKHTVWAGPLAGYLYCFINNRKHALKPFIYFITTGAVLFLVISLITKGEFFNHLLRYNMYSYSFDRLFYYSNNLLSYTGILFVFITSVFFSKKFYRSPVFLYLIFSVLSLFLLGREGASNHYLFEICYACCLTAGLGIAYIDAETQKIVVRIVVFLLVVVHISLHGEIFEHLQVPDSIRTLDRIAVDKIKSEKGRVLAEDTGMLLVAGKTVYMHSFAISKLVEKGVFPKNLFYGLFHQRFFNMVILDSKLTELKPQTVMRFTKESLYLIYEYYEHEASIGNYEFYTLKKD
ncbi:glycosyltransferase family 39 protein [bacterium]|nr:glycosyltransferase family 39 protein [bacterium]